MTQQDLIELASNRLATLNNQRASALARGDADKLATLDADVAETEQTLQALRSLT